MIARRISKKILIILLGDLLLLYAVLWTTLKIRYHGQGREFLFEAHFIPFSIVFFLWLALLGAFGMYELRLMKNSRLFLLRLLRVMTANTALAIIIFYLFRFEIEPRRNLFVIALLATAFIFAWRYLLNFIIPRAPATRVAFLGITPETVALIDWLLVHPQLGYKPVALISNGGPVSSSLPTLKHFSLKEQHFPHIVRDTKTELAVISPEMKENKTVVKALFAAIPQGISMIDFPAFHEMLTGKIPLSFIEEAWFLENLIGIRRHSYDIAKRLLDILIAVTLAIPALAIFPLAALAIKLDSEGPVFFRQKRLGKHGREFTLVKYRSMVKRAQEMSGFKGQGPDRRITRVGALLRRSYIDEIPQIINILKGEMSFVGSRPERPEFVTELRKQIPFYEMRLLVPPGITGWAQIHMENDASVEDAPEKMQYDLYYVKNRSLLLDFLIMLRTLFIILRREGR